MPLNIRNPRAEQLARKVSQQPGETLTQAVIQALEDRLQRLGGRRTVPDLTEEILEISRRCRDLPDLDPRTADEILDYGSAGEPA